MLTIVRSRIADFISPENAAERRSLERRANYDALTGLASRAALDLALPAAEADPDVAIVFFDVNNFGKLNKWAGHAFGDILLKEIAACIAAAAVVFGIGERVFRYGGDEFVVLCPADLADQFRLQVERSFGVKYPPTCVSISGSIGPDIATADSTLQARKGSQKAAHLELVK